MNLTGSVALFLATATLPPLFNSSSILFGEGERLTMRGVGSVLYLLLRLLGSVRTEKSGTSPDENSLTTEISREFSASPWLI